MSATTTASRPSEIQQHPSSNFIEILKLQPTSIYLTRVVRLFSVFFLWQLRSCNRLPDEDLEILLQYLDGMLIDLRLLIGEVLVQETDEKRLWNG